MPNGIPKTSKVFSNMIKNPNMNTFINKENNGVVRHGW